MFDAYCPRHAARVVLGPRRIRRLAISRDGAIEIHFRCYCGHEGVWRTGKRTPDTLDTAVA